MGKASPKVRLRLSDDALRLEGCFSAEVLDMNPRRVLGFINEACAELGVEYSLIRGELNLRALNCRPEEWAPILWAAAPAPAEDGRIEVLVPLPVSTGRGLHGARNAVKAGTPLARKVPAVPRKPAYDLRGNELRLRPAREATLPQGHNTVVSPDGTMLLAACDGEVRLTGMRIEILPMHVAAGDVAPGGLVVRPEEPVFVTGSVGEGARIDAFGDVHVMGSILEADVLSGSSISVLGSVTGSSARPCTIQAEQCVTLKDAQFASIYAGSDIRIMTRATDCAVQAQGNLYLASTLEDSLERVNLRVHGGVFPAVVEAIASGSRPQLRQHIRIGCNLPCVLAKHEAAPLTFVPCTIVDLSEGGCRCRLRDCNTSSLADTTVQLKFELPSSEDLIIALARVAWSTDAGLPVTQSAIDWAPAPTEGGPGWVGMAFLHLSAVHREMIAMFCQMANQRLFSRYGVREFSSAF
jgi:hypothetical protein